MSTTQTSNGAPWWRELNRYHWFVLTVAALGWLFDTLDQQLFVLARVPAMRELLAPGPGLPVDPKKIAEYGGYATSIFLMGWAAGGLFFGVLGDRIGRAKTMMWTILIYSICTGLSAFSKGFWDFAFYRFVTGLGVGGEFAVGVALVAEVMPDRARPYALGLLQALSAVGNIGAALISIFFGQLQGSGVITSAWRGMFLVGALPALVALLVRSKLKEPERWQAAKGVASKQFGSYAELLGNPKWRRHTFVALWMAFCGVVGLWGIGFFTPDLTRTIFQKTFVEQGHTPQEVQALLGKWAGITSIMLNSGAFFGIYGFGPLSQRIGRKKTFLLAYLLAFTTTVLVFWNLRTFNDIFWMLPLMGFSQLALFGGFAIYFPELFPTHLRSTGTSFCYNVGRFAAAAGPFVLGKLTSVVYASQPESMRMRYAGVTMCCIFLLALLALPFAPETKDQALPEDERGGAH